MVNQLAIKRPTDGWIADVETSSSHPAVHRGGHKLCAALSRYELRKHESLTLSDRKMLRTHCVDPPFMWLVRRYKRLSSGPHLEQRVSSKELPSHLNDLLSPAGLDSPQLCLMFPVPLIEFLSWLVQLGVKKGEQKKQWKQDAQYPFVVDASF